MLSSFSLFILILIAVFIMVIVTVVAPCPPPPPPPPSPPPAPLSVLVLSLTKSCLNFRLSMLAVLDILLSLVSVSNNWRTLFRLRTLSGSCPFSGFLGNVRHCTRNVIRPAWSTEHAGATCICSLLSCKLLRRCMPALERNQRLRKPQFGSDKTSHSQSLAGSVPTLLYLPCTVPRISQEFLLPSPRP